MSRRNLIGILIFLLVIVGMCAMCYIGYLHGKESSVKVITIKQHKKDSTIALYKAQLDSLTHYTDSISQELDVCQNEIARYVYSVDYLTHKDPKAADQFIDYFLHETE